MARRRKNPKSPQRRLYVANTKARSAVHKRFRTLVQEFGGVTHFARTHGIMPKYVYKWYSNGMVPGTNYLIKFAKVSGISPDWVLLGRGKPYMNGKPTTAAKAA